MSSTFPCTLRVPIRVYAAGNSAIGSLQSITVYGRVPAQSTPAAGDYTDTVLVTFSY